MMEQPWYLGFIPVVTGVDFLPLSLHILVLLKSKSQWPDTLVRNSILVVQSQAI